METLRVESTVLCSSYHHISETLIDAILKQQSFAGINFRSAFFWAFCRHTIFVAIKFPRFLLGISAPAQFFCNSRIMKFNYLMLLFHF